MSGTTATHGEDQSGRVDSVEKLRTIIKPPAKVVAEKRQSTFEVAGQYLLDRVRGAAFVTAGQGESFHISMATGKPGFARILDATTIRVSGVDEESVSNLRVDAAFGGLFMIPGVDYKDGRTEDAVIAYTWNHFVSDPHDAEWLLRLP